MNTYISKPLSLPKSGRLKPYYDTQKVVKDKARLHFFPAQVQRDTTRNNYVSNPIPGPEVRDILQIKVDSNIAAIKSAADVDPIKIINRLKHASLKLTLNSDNVQVIEQPLSDFLDLGNAMTTGGFTTAGALVDVLASIPTRGPVRVADPFRIGQNQSFDVQINFDNAADFPNQAQWDAAGFGTLELTVTLFCSEFVKN